MKKYQTLFLSEAETNLETLNKALLTLEKNPEDTQTMTTLMRAAHTLKSSSAAMGYTQISQLVHRIEDIFDDMRNGKEKYSPSYNNTLFAAFDGIANSIQAIKLDKPELDMSALLNALEHLKENDGEKGVLPKAQQTKVIEDVPVDIKILDNLANLSEELLVNRMRLSEISAKEQYSELPIAIDMMSRLITELQYNITQARMVPLDEIFTRFPRLIRDMASKEDKEIEFEMEGGKIELDRSIVEKIGEPLIHLLRNAVDHGIAEKGKVKLSAKREKAFVVISVTNIGKSINREAIKKKALKKQLITPAEAQVLGENKILEILTNSNFSTSTKVTETSGRGIGVNIVKMVVESLGGKFTLQSPLPGDVQGAKFTLKLPITIAIVHALLVKVSNHRYAIPLSNVRKSVRLEAHHIKSALNKKMAMLEDMQVPLVDLKTLMGIPQTQSETTAPKKHSIAVVIKKTDTSNESLEEENYYAILVDEIISNQEVVVKSLTGMVKNMHGFAGVTILGNGKPALILDIDTLF
jgi:two-component system, chemotaxis family, sensor kinase CheA